MDSFGLSHSIAFHRILPRAGMNGWMERIWIECCRLVLLVVVVVIFSLVFSPDHFLKTLENFGKL